MSCRTGHHICEHGYRIVRARIYVRHADDKLSPHDEFGMNQGMRELRYAGVQFSKNEPSLDD